MSLSNEVESSLKKKAKVFAVDQNQTDDEALLSIEVEEPLVVNDCMVWRMNFRKSRPKSRRVRSIYE